MIASVVLVLLGGVFCLWAFLAGLKNRTREQIADEADDRRNHVRQSWEPHESYQLLLQDHYPTEWERIRYCRKDAYRVDRDRNRPDRYRVYPKRSCGIRPWCIQCNEAHHRARWKIGRDRIEYCTPAGEEVRLAHIVQTFPHFEDGTGWGRLVYADPSKAFAIMDEQLRWAFGPDIGWVGSFQAFGERGPRQVHPHLDLTLSGYGISDKIGRLETFTLEGGGWEAWQVHLRSVAERYFPGRVGPETAPWRLASFAHGWPEYIKALKYQTREVLDPRKTTYDRQRQLVHWWAYPKDGQPEYSSPYDVIDWMACVEGCKFRFGQWQKQGTQLTRYFGHLSDRTWRAAHAVAGGRPEAHREGCTCNECGEWERAWVPEATHALLRSRPLDYLP